MKKYNCTAPCNLDCIYKEEITTQKRKKEKGVRHIHVRITPQKHKQLREDIETLDFKSFQSWWDEIVKATHISAEKDRKHE